MSIHSNPLYLAFLEVWSWRSNYRNRNRIILASLLLHSAAVGLVFATTAPFVHETARISISEPFEGVTHHHIRQAIPRPLDMHLLIIDPNASGMGFFTTPSNGSLPGDTVHQTTRGFVAQHGLQIGINANFSSYVSGINMNLLNIAASNGDVYSPFYAGWPGINITADNQVHLVTPVPENVSHDPPLFYSGFDPVPDVPLYNTVGGNELILQNGNVIATWADGLHPRTAAGVMPDGRLMLFTVDGRNTGHSQGMSTTEVAQVLRHYGALHGVNLDGGGSTTLVFADPSPRVVNVPVGSSGQIGSERHVGNNLGLFANVRDKPLRFTHQFANFENIANVPSAEGFYFLRNPGYSGSTNANLVSAPAYNDSIVVGPGQFPLIGSEGTRALRLRWQFRSGLNHPWLRVSANTTEATLGQPIVSFEKSVRFRIHSNQDLNVLLLVRNTTSSGDYGTPGVPSGGFEFIGGPYAADGQISTLPPRGKQIRGGEWTTLQFDIPNESVTGWNVNNANLNGNGTLETTRGIIQSLIFQPARADDGSYSTSPVVVFLNGFAVTDEPPPARKRPLTRMIRGAAGRAPDLHVQGEPFAEHRVEVSGNLVDWEEVGTIETDSDGEGFFTDPEADGQLRRFYRVR